MSVRRVLTLLTTIVGVLALASPAVAAADPVWRPGTPPLTTPWTHLVGPDNALPEYPRPQLARQRWQNLNGVWEFAGAAAGEAPPFGRPLAERVLVPYPIESALSGIQRREDRMWYRRTFLVPRQWRVGRDARLRLNFGAVDYDAVVWVNGRQVTTHRGGYDSFSVDVTDALTPTGPQELIVGVTDLTDATWQPIGKQRNVPDRGIFYTSSSGIWQTVWLEPVAPANITALDQTPDVAGAALGLTVRTSGDTAGLTVEAIAFDGSRAVGRVTGAPGARLRVPVPDAKLWSPDSPFLYDLRVRLLRGGRVVDEVGSYFGMRAIGTARGADGRLRMTLNGRILFHMSTLDQGFWPDGIHTAPTDEALRFDLEQHKVLGFNTVRKHIKVEPDRWYYHADRLGLLVWQDMPAMRLSDQPPPPDARAQFERELRTMVDKHSGFPSIVVWVPFNEGWGEWDRAETGRIADEVKAADPSRLVDAHSGVNCCLSKGDSGRGDILDHHQYVGPASPVPTATRVSADGEHGGLGLEVDGHMWFGEGHAYEMAPDPATLTRRYVENQRDVLTTAQRCGISAAVYTQITDVEHEVNGFFTYDRQVRKLDFDQVRAVNEAIIRSADGSGGGPAPGPGTPGADGIAYYPFSEGAGTVTADAVGDHDATLTGGASWTEGHPGPGIQFNGSTSTVDTGAGILDTAGNYTVAAWVKLDSLGGFATAVSRDGPANSAFFLQYSGADNRFAFSFTGVRALAPAAPETGRWYHLVGVRDVAAGSLTLYVDGQPAGAANACDGDPGTGNTVIGRAKFAGNPVDFWRGAIDQVHLFDRALPAAEVAALYASGR
ncbi:MAG TPA: LamG-like jellyroll fold domain-containing protein [Actinophytocola sp.]|uniref:LamG-like jellyroll fold domain-containing protein n=1 Tax=Actinophytocola sp. TaxID=1872138 RepID=UPI002DDD40D1|nr:LamG-like jellyroll fold domain-containing protein [Actinophytocola sp.]HEV2778434.1 LamG-like jellyroll fold domain-containing protein [Actinophytocola sp.]